MIQLDEIKIIKSGRSSISISINSLGKVVVKAPNFAPKFLIHQFIKSKSDWIEKRIEMVNNNKPKKKNFTNGEKFMYLGQEVSLEIGNYIHIEIKGGKLLFPLGLIATGNEALEKWYIKQAKRIISNYVEFYAKELNTDYNAISFSDTSSKWGSCTHDNRLQFNWRLIMAPLLVVRYVILHELVHTTEKNHSRVFWNKVRKINPSYKNQIKWLKENSNKLHF